MKLNILLISLNQVFSGILCANGVKIQQFKVKDSEIKLYALSLGNISKGFTVNNKKKSRLEGKVYDFFISYEKIDVSDIDNIYKHLMKKQNIV